MTSVRLRMVGVFNVSSRRFLVQQVGGLGRMRTGEQPRVADERWEFLDNLNAFVDPVLTVLGFVWLGLVILDLGGASNPTIQTLTLVLWAVFIADYLLELLIAPDRLAYVKGHWIGAVALVIPAFRFLAAFRVLRVFRSLRAVRTVSLARVLASTNRGLRSVRAFFGRRQIGVLFTSSLMVTLAGAAAIHFFERSQNGPIQNFGDALWWSAMMLTTMGSEFWPATWEGRIVAWLLAVYAFAVFGYVTAALASHFIQTNQTSD